MPPSYFSFDTPSSVEGYDLPNRSDDDTITRRVSSKVFKDEKQLHTMMMQQQQHQHNHHHHHPSVQSSNMHYDYPTQELCSSKRKRKSQKRQRIIGGGNINNFGKIFPPSLRMVNISVYFCIILFVYYRTMYNPTPLINHLIGPIIETKYTATMATTTPKQKSNGGGGGNDDASVDNHASDAATALLLNQQNPSNIEQQQQRVIHIIHSRFMQNQPNLVDLGLARLQLLKHITMPSLQIQTSQNYLWVIRTDPSLNDTLKDSLLELLEEYHHRDNYLVIPSNENPNIQQHEILKLDENAGVWGGNMEWARRYLDDDDESNQPINVDGSNIHRQEDKDNEEEENNTIFLESRLDVDDALNRDFVESIQKNAIDYQQRRWKKRNKSSTNDDESKTSSSSWVVWCAARHIEWQYHHAAAASDAWDNDENDDDDELTGDDTNTQNIGSLISLKDSACISAGLTVGYTPGVQVHDLPPLKHDKLPKLLPSCRTTNNKGLPSSLSSRATYKHDSSCLDFLDLSPTALRARTPTSAGMFNILFNNADNNKKDKNDKSGDGKKHNNKGNHGTDKAAIMTLDPRYERGAMAQRRLQSQLWQIVEQKFGFTIDQAGQLHEYIHTNMVAIAQDNLIGQCTAGHSCKKSAKAILQAIIDNPDII